MRRNPTGHLGFAVGVHSCAGQVLARLEIRAVLAALARHVTRIEARTPVEMHRVRLLEAEAVIQLEETFEGVYALEVHELTDELVRGSVAVRNTVKQPHGIVHGGVDAAMAESLKSQATHGAAARVVPRMTLAIH